MARRKTKTNKTGRKARRPARDHYQEITDKIVAALEDGVAPWVRPWDAGLGLPHNGVSGHVYRGMNTWICWLSGFEDPRWYTFNQLMKVNGYERNGRRWNFKGKGPEPTESVIPKGTKSTGIVHWHFVPIKEKDANGDEKVVRVIPQLKVWHVFNHEQVNWAEGCEPVLVKRDFDPAQAEADALAMMEAVAKVKHGGAKACYVPGTDALALPAKRTFKTVADYLCTRAHETAHWTGHADRCDRDLNGRFGSESYAAEELVAEMAAAFICGDYNLPGNLQHAEYIASWIKVLRNDKYALFTAARLAKEATEFIYKAAGDNAPAAANASEGTTRNAEAA